MINKVGTPQLFHILAIEDNAADVYLLRLAMTEAGLKFDLKVIADGAAAISYIRHEKEMPGGSKPDLAVLDLNLPSVGGLEILTAFRQSPYFQTLPVAILTSSSSPREKSRAMELGVALFLRKAASLQEFMKVGRLLKDMLTGNQPPRR